LTGHRPTRAAPSRSRIRADELEYRARVLEIRFWGVALLKVECARFTVQGSGFRVKSSGFRVQGLGFRVQGSGFRV